MASKSNGQSKEIKDVLVLMRSIDSILTDLLVLASQMNDLYNQTMGVKKQLAKMLEDSYAKRT